MRRWKHDVFRFKDILAHVGHHIAAIDKQQRDLPNLLRSQFQIYRRNSRRYAWALVMARHRSGSA